MNTKEEAECDLKRFASASFFFLQLSKKYAQLYGKGFMDLEQAWGTLGPISLIQPTRLPQDCITFLPSEASTLFANGQREKKNVEWMRSPELY